MKGFVTFLVLVGISAGVFALGSLRRGADDKPILHVAEEVALSVTTAMPAREEIVRLVQAPGDVEAVLEVDISSEIVAKIEEMPVEEGDIVKAGDLLCRLDDDKLRAEVESAEARIDQLRASITQAEADLEKAERDVVRQRALSESHATSLLEMADYLTQLKKMKAVCDMREAELVQAQAILKRMREDLKRTVITSPIDGVISLLRAKQGEVVVTGTMNNPGTVIMTISDLSKMQVRTRVDEVDVPLVKAGQKARIYLQADPDKPVPARVIRVASKGTRPTGRDVVTFETLLEVLSPPGDGESGSTVDERIKPAMTANVEIEVAKQTDAVTVPIEAIVHRIRKDLPAAILKELDARQSDLDVSSRVRQAQYLKVIYVMEGDVAKVRLVDVGISDTRRAEIRSGIDLSDVVITGPYRSLDQLADGKKVVLLEKEGEETSDEDSEEPRVVEDGEDAEDESDADDVSGRMAEGS